MSLWLFDIDVASDDWRYIWHSKYKIILIGVMLDRADSEYSLSLQYLVKSYTTFIDSLETYLKMPLTASNKLNGLLSVWNHPRGIQNLIRTLALQFDPPARPLPLPDSFPTSPPSLPPPSVPASVAFEVPNALFAESNEVKVEEGVSEDAEGSKDESPGAKEGVSGSPMEEELADSLLHRYKRGPYKSYTMEEKERAVQLLLEDEMPITEISRRLQIPCKNIKRWSTEGVFRKRGGGRRRSTPQME